MGITRINFFFIYILFYFCKEQGKFSLSLDLGAEVKSFYARYGVQKNIREKG